MRQDMSYNVKIKVNAWIKIQDTVFVSKEAIMKTAAVNKNYSDMTRGSILPILWRFALPLMLGGLFQDLYSIADMTIAGHTLGDHALAAISATSAIIMMMNYAARGYNLGNSILVSNAFGEGDMEKTRKAFIVMIELCVAYSVVMTTVFLSLLGILMKLVNTPPELYADAKTYAMIIIAGLSCTMAYNLFASAFKALGNSKVPLYFLIFSSFLNIIFDYVCIVVFGLGVAGAAYATIFSQLISAVLSGYYFFKMFPEMKFQLDDLKGNGEMAKDMFLVGISVAITNSIFAIGAVAIQGAINSLGSDTIIAQSSCSKIRAFATIPSVNIANTAATFAAQNFGAKKFDRITKGIWVSMAMSFAFNVVTFVIIFLLGDNIVRLITNTKNENVVYMAQTMLNIECAFIWAQTGVMSFRMCIQSLKRKVVPMFGTAIELVIRCFFAFVMTPVIGFRAISLAEPASWLISGAAMMVCYFVIMNKLKKQYAQQIPVDC